MSLSRRLADLRAAIWAARALRDVRRRLAAGELSPTPKPAPSALPASARRGLEALLRRRRHTCLEAALVRQRWLAAHGVPRDVVIGVGAPSDGFRAHAWLDGDDDALVHQFSELTRLAAS
jgi:hypothetical protein